MASPLLLIMLVIIFSSNIIRSLSDPRATEAALVCTNKTSSQSDRQVYVASFLAAMDAISPLVARQGYGGVVNGTGNNTVYAFGECMKDLSQTDCNLCFAQCKTQILRCLPFQRLTRGGRLFYDGCYLRYSTKKFYDNSSTTAPSGNGGGSRRVAIILAATFSAVAFLLILAFISFFAKKRVMKQKREKKQLGALLQTVNKSRLNISYETLERATDYFNNANKLGQGGSGSVYKGVLPNGQAVAVKRLFFNTTQWVDHFFNEVNLISGIQHKNLVQLLGCSITGPESLLVYEYVPNGSLHDHIFVKKNVQPLSWEDRYKIILGTAEGLAFLHEESKLRIIHRDIKLSNILVDESFTPKIADFGLARLFPEDKTHISTAIAGTLGYMAPEYVVRGKLTEKADVYSFGVLVIEVICGKRNNNAVSQNSFSVLQKAWKLYGTGKLGEAVEASLQGNFIIEEASRLLQIGLLCVQASAELRPSMSVVVKMLNNQHEIAQPTQPPFLNCSSSDISPLNRSGTPYFQSDSYTQSSGNDMTDSFIEAR
ncbi:cysteine-rich receptor-like protein kinase 3 isoform X3 [Coffea arabica]|uniref:Cysteine-rich receptor-like protein kinase 3 isoform X3 n=1 Tax=Coffea arabica TaxID=13443 RepID=A0ABM4W5W5_COFAR